MSLEKMRYWWWKRQGLDGSLAKSNPAVILTQSGWSRSVGGVGPYLTMFARGHLDRETIDQSVASTKIHELPAARNCTYVVPKCDYELALRVGQAFEGGDLRVAMKLGVKETEFQMLCIGIKKALIQKPMEPSEIRESVGKLCRGLGDEGKKKGLTTTLPLGLSRLQSLGEIRRIPIDGRLDQQRYRYTLWDPSPIVGTYAQDADAHRELARKYFAWVGPATMKEFRWFSGLGIKAAHQAVMEIGIVPIAKGDDRMVLESDALGFSKVVVPSKPQYALLSSLDTLFAARRNIEDFIDEKDQSRSVYYEKGKATFRGISDLPHHGIFDRGRLIGLWEFDVEQEAIVHQLFVKPDKALHVAMEVTQDFVRSQLGDARSFSLDTPKSRVPKIQSLLAGSQ
ncbi:MAG: crosslink repair DNA glycosylase YcaQ family protein [Pirellula sp.]